MNKFILVVLSAFLLSQPVRAEDRALLIGVGNYENPQFNLIGVDNDIKIMLETANLLGFNSIKVLQNQQVTKEAIEKAVQSWLVDGVTAQDKVLIYFSGHGSTVPDENGDEEDGIDEVLTTYNVNVVNKTTGNSLGGVIKDDDFNLLLSKIPSSNILVMLDSCHSGTATRSLDNAMMSKALIYEGMPKPKLNRAISDKKNPPKFASQKSNIVTISAANDDEESLSTANGGLFTLGFNKALKDSITNKTSITPIEMGQKVNAFIQKRVNPAEYKTFHPQVTGDEKLINTPLLLAQTAATDAPPPAPKPEVKPKTSLWADLVGFVKKTPPLSVVANQIIFGEGENLILQINPKQPGYLYIVTIDSTDSATLLFPNQNHLDNAVATGEFTFPTAKSGFKLTTQAPFGKSILAALISSEKLDLYENEKKVARPLLKKLSRWDVKNLFHTAIYAGKVEILSCKNAAQCP